MLSAVFRVTCLTTVSCPAVAADWQQKSFKTVVYVPVGEALKMKDRAWLESSCAQIISQVQVEKVYIETYRSRVLADDQLIEDVKTFFADQRGRSRRRNLLLRS